MPSGGNVVHVLFEWHASIEDGLKGSCAAGQISVVTATLVFRQRQPNAVLLPLRGVFVAGSVVTGAEDVIKCVSFHTFILLKPLGLNIKGDQKRTKCALELSLRRNRRVRTSKKV